MKKLYFLLVVVSIFISCQAQEKSPQLLSAKEFQAKVASENGQLVDVRTPKEFKQGHLKNAQNIHLYDQDFDLQIKKLDKNKPVYVYCKAGGRSAEAVEIMQNLGFQTIMELEGGTDSWTENGLPLEQ